MGLFSKLGQINKKSCSICGTETGLFKRTKLTDGYLCTSCSARLSPFWKANRKTTVEQVQDHLAYRKRNLEELETFHPDIEIGSGRQLLIDQKAGTFVLTSEDEENPDLFKLSQVRTVTTDVYEEDITETDSDGDSYHDHYEYTFYLIVDLDNPYVQHARFKLNDRPVHNNGRRIKQRDADAYLAGEKEVKGGLFSRSHKNDIERYLSWYSDLHEMMDGLKKAAGR